MKHSTPEPTAKDLVRFDKLKRMPCIACWIHGYKYSVEVPEIHHLLSGNKRRGHEYTIPLCAWHHRGEPWLDWKVKGTRSLFGPSLARESKQFRAKYGSDEELLAEVNRRINQ